MTIALTVVLVVLCFLSVKAIRNNIKKVSIRHDAYHEAGHAVVSLALGYGFEKVSVGKDETGERGYVKPHTDSFNLDLPMHNEDIIKIAVAGVLASNMKYVGNHQDEGYSDDVIVANALNRKPSLAAGNEEEYLRRIRREVKRILHLNKASLDIIAALLADRKTLTEEDILLALDKAGLCVSPTM